MVYTECGIIFVMKEAFKEFLRDNNIYESFILNVAYDRGISLNAALDTISNPLNYISSAFYWSIDKNINWLGYNVAWCEEVDKIKRGNTKEKKMKEIIFEKKIVLPDISKNYEFPNRECILDLDCLFTDVECHSCPFTGANFKDFYEYVQKC